MGQGFQLITEWVYFKERGRASSFNSSGGTTGTVLTWSLFPLLIDGATTWTGAFYVPAGSCLIWSAFWVTFVTSRPEDNT